jgi:hypothetical protein
VLGNLLREFFYKLFQDHLGSSAPTCKLRKLDLQNKREAASAQKTAEWGMHMLQTSFPQVKDWFVDEKRVEQRIYLKMLVLLYNMCVT